MAALWLHTASVLVLLVMSCPGSQAIASQYLCGSHLVDALHLICGDRGFIYMPTSGANPVPRVLPPMARGAASMGGENEGAKFASQDQMEMMVKRNIVERCCHRPCSLFDLESYCY
ncbi:insulin-like [Seriola dumerili]|uniref:Insulin n=1 Tax=Seriola dumerili TaxID=41447 RepID=Q18NR1_SERDU|nr:insulin-like [Seriola dumerili]BAE96119.1 insulin [Seriola dumerili]